MTRVLKIFASILALATFSFAYTSLRDPVRKVITRYELEHRGGVRLVFDVELDPSLAAAQQAERLAHTGRVLATRFERATGRFAFAHVEDNQLLIDMPTQAGAKLTPAFVEAVTVPAFLEFRAVDDDDTSLAALQASLPPGVLLEWDRYLGQDGTVSASFLRCASHESLADFIRGKAPGGRELAIGRVGTVKSDSYRTYLLQEKPVLTGANVTDARVEFEQDDPYVNVTFNAEGAALFAKFTAENVKKRIAIVLDGFVYSAPVVQSAIPGGICSIHLGGLKRPVYERLEQAKNLSLVLKSGALPARVRLVSMGQFSPASGPGPSAR